MNADVIHFFIARFFILVRCHYRGIKQVVRAFAPYTVVNAVNMPRVPPMHNVSLEILMSTATDNMSPHQRRIRIYQCQAVLKLIAEAVCAAALIKRAARVHSASRNLIGQKEVHQRIGCRTARCYFNFRDHRFGKGSRITLRAFDEFAVYERYDLLCARFACSCTDEKDDVV